MSEKWNRALPIICLVALTWLVFWPAVRAGFVLWDDPDMLIYNPELNPPSWDKVAGFWNHPVLKLYTPVAYTTWSAVAAMENVAPGAELRPAPFHLLNLFLHTATVVLVFVLLQELGAGVWPAWAGAALFAVHPLQVEPVVWIAGMNNVLCGMFSVAALWQYVVYAKAARDGKDFASCGWRFGVATVLFAAALLSKPTALMLPAVALVIDLGIIRRPLNEVLPALCLWGAMAFQAGNIARTAQPTAAGAAPPWGDRALVAVDAVGFYATKLLAPLHLGMDYGRTPAWVAAHATAAWRGAAVLLAAAVICLFRAAGWLRVPIAVTLIVLLPVLGLVPFDFQYYSTVTDRYMYLPMIGIAMAAAGALQRLQGFSPRVAAGIILALLAGRSFAQTGAWHDTQSLTENEFKIDPDNSTAHTMWGAWLSDSGRYQEAEQEYLRGFAAMKGEGKALRGLDYLYFGEILGREGRYREAIPQFQIAIPLLATLKRAEACYNYGVALYHLGDMAGAREQFQAALDLRPDFEEARANLQKTEQN
jgi:protein O-mannosyl-transferase